MDQPGDERSRVATVGGWYDHQAVTDKPQESIIKGMRQFNNWIKSVMLCNYTTRGTDCILDLGCGKFGDLRKFDLANPRYYVGTDISKGSLESGIKDRIASLRKDTFPLKLIRSSFFGNDLDSLLPSDILFNLVTCQFSLHYAFGSEANARQLLKNASSRLTRGGYFLVTTVDANVVVKKLREAKKSVLRNSIYSIELSRSAQGDVNTTQKSSSSETTELEGDRLGKRSRDDFEAGSTFEVNETTQFKPFGTEVFFNLESSLENCPEYLVNQKILVELCRDYGMELVETSSFHEFFAVQSNNPKHRSLLQKIVRDPISVDEWEAISLYRVYVFKKIGAGHTSIPYERILRSPFFQTRNHTILDILDQTDENETSSSSSSSSSSAPPVLLPLASSSDQ